MRFYGIGQMSQNEKNNILNKHQELYSGYKRVHNVVNDPQPLFVQDFANDKVGITVNNTGEVTEYSNKIYMKESKEEMCSECGSVMSEGMCGTCGWQGEMEEGIYDEEDINLKNDFDYVEEEIDEDHTEFYEPMVSAFSDELDEIEGPLYSKVEPAYDFESDGPMQAKGPYHQNEELDEIDLDKLIKGKKYKFELPHHEDDELEYQDKYDYPEGQSMYGFKNPKKSEHHTIGTKFVQDYIKDIDESESDFDSETFDLEDEGEKDTAFSRMRRGHKPVDIDWEDIDTVWSKIKRGQEPEDIEFEDIDEDIQESFLLQKHKINEMFNRFKKYN